MGVNGWSRVADENASADLAVPATNIMPARLYAESIRGVMAGTRAFADLIGGALDTSGAANAYAVASDTGATVLRRGLYALVRAHEANTGPATLDFDELGPLPWVNKAGEPLGAGQVAAGSYYPTVLDADADDTPVAWRILTEGSLVVAPPPPDPDPDPNPDPDPDPDPDPTPTEPVPDPGKLSRQASDITLLVPGDFPTVQAAVDVASVLAIDPSVWVTIEVTAGRYAPTAPVAIRTPYGDRIRIRGAAPVTTPISATVSVAGSAQNYSVRYTVGSTAGLQPGDLVTVTATAGPVAHQTHQGAWEVLSIHSATSLTVRNTAANGAPPAGVTGTLTIYPTQIAPVAVSGFVVASLGELTRVALKGDRTTPGAFGVWGKSIGAIQGGAAVLSMVAVAGFGADNVRANYGGIIHCAGVISSAAVNNNFLARDDGTLTAMDCVATGAGLGQIPGGGNGLLAQNSSTSYLTSIVAWGNWGDGVSSRSASSVVCDTSAPGSSGRNRNGWMASFGGFLQAVASVGNYNAEAGYRCETNAQILAAPSTALSNGVNGYYALEQGFISSAGSTSQNNTYNGWSAVDGGRIDADGATGGGNGSQDYIALSYGSILRQGTRLEGVPPPPDTGPFLQAKYAPPYRTWELLAARIPFDDTKPQATEGVEILSVSIKPSATSSRIRLRFNGEGATAVPDAFIAAIFRDGDANAIQAGYTFISSDIGVQSLTVECEDTPASTATLTYRVRVGVSGTQGLYLNGDVFGRRLGGASGATLVAEEIKA